MLLRESLAPLLPEEGTGPENKTHPKRTQTDRLIKPTRRCLRFWGDPVHKAIPLRQLGINVILRNEFFWPKIIRRPLFLGLLAYHAASQKRTWGAIYHINDDIGDFLLFSIP
ncbi:MAG: hypothetical protein HYY81_08525 [Deltaproteobacteria bacterium]|nr:hypothetical protein [Deltaproteobacteria bacterium]